MSEREVRAAKFKLLLTKEDREVRRFLLEIGDKLKVAVNLIWRVWMQWHWEAQSEVQLRAWRAEFTAWKQNGGAKADKPACPVKPLPPDCTKRIYDCLHGRFPELHGRLLELKRNTTQKRIRELPARSGRFPGWLRVLCNEDRPAFSSDAQPIPFDSKASRLIAPELKTDPWLLEIRLDRPLDGSRSTPHRFRLRTFGRRCASERSKLEKIAAGEYRFCGSQLVYRSETREWFAHVSYQQPKVKPEPLDPGRVVVLKPGRKRIALARFGGFTRWLGGRHGRHVAHVRNHLLVQLWSRKSGYRMAGSARKGHGRNKGFRFWLRKMRRRWRDFVKTQNEAIAWDVVRFCQRHGAGRVVYLQPTGDARLTRFLATAGNPRRGRAAYSWDWYQLGKIAGRKCHENGIAFETRKREERGFSTADPPEPKPAPALTADGV